MPLTCLPAVTTWNVSVFYHCFGDFCYSQSCYNVMFSLHVLDITMEQLENTVFET
jgi:hypothetical protein